MAFTDNCQLCGFLFCDCLVLPRSRSLLKQKDASALALDTYKHILEKNNKPSKWQKFKDFMLQLGTFFLYRR